MKPELEAALLNLAQVTKDLDISFLLLFVDPNKDEAVITSASNLDLPGQQLMAAHYVTGLKEGNKFDVKMRMKLVTQ